MRAGIEQVDALLAKFSQILLEKLLHDFFDVKNCFFFRDQFINA
jgi:hypothetical protein